MKNFIALIISLSFVSAFGQIKLDQNNKVGLRTLNPSYEIESWGEWRYGLSTGALIYDQQGQFGMPNLHPEECWGGGLGTVELRYFDLWVHDIFTDQLFFPDPPDLWGQCNPESGTGEGGESFSKTSVNYGIDDLLLIEPELISRTSQSGDEYYFRIPASNLKEAMPEMVKSVDGVDYVNQVALISVLINVVKEQDEAIKNLQLSSTDQNNKGNSSSLDSDDYDEMNFNFEIVPNPVDQKFELIIPNGEFSGQLIITTLNGSVISRFSVNTSAGKQAFSLDRSNVSSGIYLFSLIKSESNEVSGTKRIFVK